MFYNIFEILTGVLIFKHEVFMQLEALKLNGFKKIKLI